MAERLIFWRHGQSGGNAQGFWQGQLDVPLTDLGEQQASAAAGVLSQIVDGSTIIISSDLQRAANTAQKLADLIDVSVIHDERLREVNAGAWQGLTRDQIALNFADDYRKWRRGADIKLGGGEAPSQAGLRVGECIAEFTENVAAQNLIICGHGGALRGGVLHLLGLDTTRWNLMSVLNNAHWGVLRHNRRINQDNTTTGSNNTWWRLDAWNVGAG